MAMSGKREHVNLSYNESIFSIYHEQCRICKSQFVNPHVLSCLHIFCEQCLIYTLCRDNTYMQNDNYRLTCPACNKMVTVGLSGFRSLLLQPPTSTSHHKDNLNLFDCSLCGIGTKSVFCCQYCLRFLCPGCLSTHNFVICANNKHHTESNRRLNFCHEHNKFLKYYCFQCETMACIFCLVQSHHDGEHVYDLIVNAENDVRSEIQSLLSKAKDKISNCNSTVSYLLDILTKLQHQHDNAKHQVQSNCESYMKYAEKCRSNALKKLEDLYLKREIDVRSLLNEVATFIKNIEETCRINKKHLIESDSLELLNLRKVVPFQFARLNDSLNISESSIGSSIKEMDGLVRDVLTQFCEKISIEQKSLSGTIEPVLSSTQIEPEDDGTTREPVTVTHAFSTVPTNESILDLIMPMTVNCKIGSIGAANGEFHDPQGFCLRANDEILVADTNNHRIQVFHSNGSFKFQFGNPGREEECLWFPRKVAANKRIVVNDRGVERTRFQIFSEHGVFLRKIPFFDIGFVASLAMNQEGYIVIADSTVPSICIINELGELIRRFDCSSHIIEPSDMVINGTEFFICDYKGHRVGVFNETGVFQRYIGNNKLLSYPNGIDISKRGDVFISDSDNNQFNLAQFNRDGTFVKAYVCERLKISRCCGLRLNACEQMITLSRRNNTLFFFDKIIMQRTPAKVIQN